MMAHDAVKSGLPPPAARRFPPNQLLRYAGLLLWFSTLLVVALAPLVVKEPLLSWRWFGLWGAELLFGLLYWWDVRSLQAERRGGPLWRLGAMTVLALLATWLGRGGGIGGLLLVIVGSLLPWRVRPDIGLVWIVVQSVLLGLGLSSNPEVNAINIVLFSAIFMALGLFAYIASLVAMRHALAREALRQVNSELRATQALLAENTRIAERVRIARELHDVVGHHLTALSLNLEVAAHLCDGKPLEHVQQARAIARLLLSDVREVVSELRRSDRVDLAQALAELVEGVPRPKIHLALPPGIAAVDPSQAQVLLRCAQEIISNTARHARAENLWLTIEEQPVGLQLVARDDGCGAAETVPGNGLNGMAERVRQVGGKLNIETRPGAGFTVRAWLPRPIAA